MPPTYRDRAVATQRLFAPAASSHRRSIAGQGRRYYLVPDRSQFQGRELINGFMPVEVSGKFQCRLVVLVVTPIEPLLGVVEIGYRYLVEGDVFCPVKGEHWVGLPLGNNPRVFLLGLLRTVESEENSLTVDIDNGVLAALFIQRRSAC